MSRRDTILYTPFSILLAGAILSLSSAVARPAFGQDPSVSALQGTLDYYINYGLENSPALLAAESNWMAERADAGQVGAPPRPMLEWMEGGGHSDTLFDMIKRRITLRQSFPWLGTLGALKRSEEFDAQAAQSNLTTAKQNLILSITESYWNGALLERKKELTQQTLELLAMWEATVRTRYETGLASYNDLLTAQIEIARLSSSLEEIELMKQVSKQELASLINLNPTESVFYADTIFPRMTNHSTDTLSKLLSENNPELNSARLQTQSAQSYKTWVSRSNMPNFMIGMEYTERRRAGHHDIPQANFRSTMVMFGLDIPLWIGANGARSRLADRRISEAQHLENQMLNALQVSLQSAVYDYHDAQRRITLYAEQIIPRALQARDVALSAYESGASDIYNVIESAQRLLDFEIAYETACIDSQIGYARIIAIIEAPDNNKLAN